MANGGAINKPTMGNVLAHVMTCCAVDDFNAYGAEYREILKVAIGASLVTEKVRNGVPVYHLSTYGRRVFNGDDVYRFQVDAGPQSSYNDAKRWAEKLTGDRCIFVRHIFEDVYVCSIRADV